MKKKPDLEFWRECAVEYCRSNRVTLDAIKEFIANFSIPLPYVQDHFQNRLMPSAAVSAFFKYQEAVRLGLLGTDHTHGSIDVIFQEYLRRKDIAEQGSKNEMQKFARQLSLPKSKARGLKKAARLGRTDMVKTIIIDVRKLATELLEIDNDELRLGQFISVQVAILNQEAKDICDQSIGEVTETIVEALKAYAKSGSMVVVRQAMDAWAKCAVEAQAPFMEKYIPHYLNVSSATTSLPALAKQ